MSSHKNKPAPIVIGLKTNYLSSAIGSAGKSVPLRASKKRVFTEAEWAFLNRQTDLDLLSRVAKGRLLIKLLHRPEMMNMKPKLAAKTSSNLEFQIEEIHTILRSRGVNI